MKGIIFDIKRFCVNDGPGIRTTVFMKGCPLSCWWCHNPEGKSCEIQKTVRINKIGEREFFIKEDVGREVDHIDVLREVEKDSIVYEESGGGVTFSGGEPYNQLPFLKALLSVSKEKNFHTAVDTCGFTPKKNILETIDMVDLFLFDIKHTDESEHLKYTGVSNDVILDNLNMLIENKKKIIIRFPVIPGINDSKENIDGIKKLMNSYDGYLDEIHLLPFHNMAENKYKKLKADNKLEMVRSLVSEDLLQLKSEFESIGKKVKISG